MPKIDDQLKEIREIVFKNKETTERLEQNWDKDREDFSEFKNRLNHLESEFKSLREIINKLPRQTQDQVSEAAESIISEAHDLKDVIMDKEMVAIDSQKTQDHRKSWWKRLFKIKKGG